MRLVEEGKHYFLSRPRRFGKSLFVDTLKELVEGNEDLFEGLAVHGRWDWSVRFPLVRLEFGRGNYAEPGYLQVNLAAHLEEIEQEAGVEAAYQNGAERFAYLIRQLHRSARCRVAVLVDEYDKPILDALHQPDIARANREYLRGLYSVIKSCDAHVRFCFLTGVSKFSKVSLFSGLNSLEDITLNPSYSSICGYAERDLDTVFADRMDGLDRERVREWYNGYSWGGEERLYNPFDVLLLLKNRQYKNWWFETGTPGFLIDLLAEAGVAWHRIDDLRASDDLLSKFDLEDIAPEALLFQTGYLTVLESEEVDGEPSYRLGYPNREVRQSLNRALLGSLLGTGRQSHHGRVGLSKVLRDGNVAGLEEHLRSLLAGIPHDWHGRNPMADYEGWYASVLYAHFAALGVDVRAEESVSQGRADMCVRAFGRVYVFEFKMRERAGPRAALAQLKSRGYADRYRGLGEPIYLVGVQFSVKTREVTHFEAQAV